MSKYSSYILYLLTSILVVLLFVNDFGPLVDLQRYIDDSLCRMTAPKSVRPNIAIVKIDGPSFDQYGPWPWNHDLIADLTAAVGSGEPRTIVVDLSVQEDAAQDSAGYTKILAEQISWIKSVVLPYDIALATYRSGKTNNPEYLFDYSLDIDSPLGLMEESSSLQVRKLFLPADKLLAKKPMLGFNYQMPDDDRVLRHQPLAINYEGYYYPSVSLLAAASYLQVPASDIKVIEGERIMVGQERVIPINERTEIFLKYSHKSNFQQYSAAQVLAEGFDLSQFKGKVVLIAIDDPGQTLFFRSTIEADTPDFIARATVIENIINDNMLTERHDMAGISMLILFAIGAICAFVLSRVSLLYRMIILAGGLILLANFNYFMVSSMKMLVDSVFVGFELLLFMLVSPMLDSRLLIGQSADRKSAAGKLPRVELEKSMPKRDNKRESKAVPERHLTDLSDDVQNQPTAIIDTDSASVQDHQSIDIDGVDLDAAGKGSGKTEAEATTALDSESIEETEVVADGAAPDLAEAAIVRTPNDSNPTLITGTQAQITQLGRYQITGTLGKGAMGHVYRGVDPAINRPVALKTIRLDFISDPEEMAELKERLHREAQAAGKLSHPNIVTIYDVGSDGSLQYIAMEYLEGQTLEEMIKRKTQFNYRIIAQIIQQICSALQYAHDQNIVHRDIKPANIMVLEGYRVKVMDFGIARIDSNSMTKTGIAMGTPNYISPEQLQGKPVDRRADIFSLGVVLYELLIGRRPFKGENITSLIYSILHSEPNKPSNIKPQIPFLFDQIVARALEKDPARRYQSVRDLNEQISEFIEAFSAKK